MIQANAIIDRRTQSLVSWLEAPPFIDTLEDFHPACDADGLLFEDTIGDAIFGMGSSAARYATTAAFVDVVSNMVKGLAAAGDKAASSQMLKLGGGALSIAASCYGANADFDGAETSSDQGTIVSRPSCTFGQASRPSASR